MTWMTSLRIATVRSLVNRAKIRVRGIRVGLATTLSRSSCRRCRAIARPDEVWEIGWLNSRSGGSRLSDGRLRVVAFARDRSRHVREGERVPELGIVVSDI